jgi:hypothetical protein
VPACSSQLRVTGACIYMLKIKVVSCPNKCGCILAQRLSTMGVLIRRRAADNPVGWMQVGTLLIELERLSSSLSCCHTRIAVAPMSGGCDPRHLSSSRAPISQPDGVRPMLRLGALPTNTTTDNKNKSRLSSARAGGSRDVRREGSQAQGAVGGCVISDHSLLDPPLQVGLTRQAILFPIGIDLSTGGHHWP